MNTNLPSTLTRFKKLILTIPLLAVTLLLAGQRAAAAQPTIVSTVPSNGATGVSPEAAVVFTFSVAMNPTETYAFFSDVTGDFESPPVISTWSAGNTVLTYTPSPAFANNHEIQWNVIGQDAQGNILGGVAQGNFTIKAGVNGGSGTNAFTVFQVSKYAVYSQTSSALATFFTYEFFAQTTLASNRTATGVTVTIPTTGGISNLVEDSLQPEQFSKASFTPLLASFTTNYPAGDYIFKVTATASQQTTVNLPNYALPNVPQISNYAAAQAVDPSQPFTLSWNTFTNGGTADGILVEINGDSGATLFLTGGFGRGGGINGTATSVVIPAGTLPANSTNSGSLFFAHLTTTTNGGNATLAIVASVTLFAVTTTTGSSVTPAPVLAIIPSGTNVLVEWPSDATGYNLQFSTNLASSVWSAASPAPVIINSHNVVTNGISGTKRFFRLSNK
jgi:hypothetical protein